MHAARFSKILESRLQRVAVSYASGPGGFGICGFTQIAGRVEPGASSEIQSAW
jgi:hypothetical protein